MARILLLNQCFYPDHASTAQHLTDLALGLREAGHEVWALSARRSYDRPEVLYPASEVWKDIHITRISSLGLGKKSILRRILDSLSFWCNAASRLLTVPRPDLIICLTSPPMVSTLGGLAGVIRRTPLAHWVMDLNPDEAVAAGILRKGSVPERVLDYLVTWSFKRASLVVALDRFMEKRLVGKGIDPRAIFTAPPWSHDDAVRFDPEARMAFRERHGLTGKFVVMYSGNHSPCHPLQTVLEAARTLADESDIQFVFIGGGGGLPGAKNFVQTHQLRNFQFLPYQPLEAVAGSLSSADLHLVSMGDPFVGIVHPCKVYNVLRLGIPFLFSGPSDSHLGDLVARIGDESLGHGVRHGDVESTVRAIRHCRDARMALPVSKLQSLAQDFSAEKLQNELVARINVAAGAN
ncbi:glycosyltransferase family 4 protein [Verrucomicrobium sp. BvORR106]|uniref:glycosyltransferase family 4 protein n=1 Tax=Verrucomicrobium sp. BvORR106 TaxID=1403819 RepID=UPI00056F0B5C|nr:glycosyltransferase family 4 protein [Verrucomicrobium sp. BvORR106]